jgi:hypothetical protein
MTYTLTATTAIIRDADQACIPDDPRNTDYQAYLAWVAAGNTPTPYVAPVVDQVSINEAAIQAALDAMAQTRQYDTLDTAVARYASSSPVLPATDPHYAQSEIWRNEANALKAWNSQVWAAAYAYLATVKAGTNPMPTAAQAVAMMPVFTWPD